MMKGRKLLPVLLAAGVAACGDSTGSVSCQSVFAGTVTTADGSGVSGATITLRDTLEARTVPLTTAVTNQAGEFGGILSGECLSCAATILPPTGFTVPAGAPSRKPVRIQCAQTADVDFTLERVGGPV